MCVKVEACLIIMRNRLLLDCGPVEWDHCPALELRPLNAAGDDYDPPQHDPRYIQPLVKVDHDRKTNGPRHDHSQGDKGKIAKVKRLERRPILREAFKMGKEARKGEYPDKRDCPYPNRTPEHKAWINGWFAIEGAERKIPQRAKKGK